MTAPIPTSRDLAALLAARAGDTFRCPGDEYTINRSVHLARLASGFEGCRLCPHRDDRTGDSPGQSVESEPETVVVTSGTALFAAGPGLRGRYLNDLTRAMLADWAALVALRFCRESFAVAEARPCVVVGHDARPSSPDLVAGVVHGLRRGGCDVLDVGLVPQPVAWFAMARYRARAVAYVTGAGCEVSWNGLDVTEAGPKPWSAGDWPTGGEATGLVAAVPVSERGGLTALREESRAYVEWLSASLHGVRPLRMVLAAPHAPQRRLVEQLLAPVALRVTWVDCGLRPLASEVADDPDLSRVKAETVAGNADLGVLLHEDGFGLTVLDETGAAVGMETLADWLGAERGVAAASTAHLWLPAPTDVGPVGRGPEECREEDPSSAAGLLPTLMCDGVVTLLAIIARLSETDAPLSLRVG